MCVVTWCIIIIILSFLIFNFNCFPDVEKFPAITIKIYSLQLTGLIGKAITAMELKGYCLLYCLIVSQYQSWLEWQGLSWFEKCPGTGPARCAAHLIAFLVFIYVIDNSRAPLHASASSGLLLLPPLCLSSQRNGESTGEDQKSRFKEIYRKN